MSIQHLPYQIDEKANRFHFYETHWKKCGLRLLQKHFPESSIRTVLDYGSGRGEVAELFGSQGYDVTSTDTDPACIELSSQHSRSVLLDTDDPTKQFGEKSYDAVVCFHVLEHVPSPVESLSVISKIARKAVVIAVPNLQTLTGLFRRNANHKQVNDGHLQSWDHSHFLNLAENHANLKLIEWGFDTTILPIFNRYGPRILGNSTMIKLETGIFNRMFPFHSMSVLGIFKPV